MSRGADDGERWRLCLVRFLFWETTGGWLPCGECPLRKTCEFEGRDQDLRQ